MKIYTGILSVAVAAALCAHGETIFVESFESPDVGATSVLQYGATIKLGAVPGNGHWIASTEGYGAKWLGMVNKAFGDYSAPSGNNQGYYFGYTNTGLTSSTSSITETLQPGVTYTVSFDVARDNDVTSSSYIMELVAFGTGDTDILRKDVRGGRPGFKLATTSGTVTTNDLSKRVSFSFKANDVTHAAQFGKTLGIRMLGNSTRPIIDNIELSSDGGDGDGDGMVDAWEILHFGNLSHNGTADSDGDRLTDLFEFQVGLNPTSTDSNGDGFGDWVGYLPSEGETILLTETFETPDVSGTSTTQYGATFKLNTVPSGGNWIGSTTGFGADRRGLIHKSFGDFTVASGNQGYYFGYSNSGLTSSAEAMSHLLTEDVDYTVSFDVARDNNKTQSNYRMELVALDPAAGNTGRNNVTGSKPGVVLAFKSGVVTTNDLSTRVTLSFKVNPSLHAAHIGKALAVRFIGDLTNPILDNVEFKVVDSDTDGDGLGDDWERLHFGGLHKDGTADTDGDTLSDGFEYEAGLNPKSTDSNGDGLADWIGVPGYLSADEWHGLPGSSLADLFGNQAFYGQPDNSYYLSKAKAGTNTGDDYGICLRGTIKAPVTGAYRFWIAGEGESVLNLSSDAAPFNRRKIASVATSSAVEGWDATPGQKSALINLVQGQEYYIEALMKAGSGADHLAVAWEYPNQARQVIPQAVLKSFVPHPDDQDDDGMLDSWETQVGLNPNDNGFNSLSESAYLDPDNDGLRTFEEFFANGNPFQVGGNQGHLELDVWNGITGTTVRNLTDSSKFAGVPDQRTWTTATFQSMGDNYGARLRGTLTPTIPGEYHLYVSGNDAAELWFAQSGDRFGKRKVSWNSSPTNLQQWDLLESQKSEIIQLEANQSYHIEALLKDGSGSDHLSLGWARLNPTNVSWTTTDIDLTQPSTWTENGDAADVTTLGGDIWTNSDKFTYRYTEMTGDCVLTARVPSMVATQVWAKAGLVIRGSLAANSQNIAVLRTGEGRIVNQSRSTIGNITQSGFRTDPAQPDTWLRLVRAGTQVILYSSEDGESWKRISKGGLTLGSTYYVGLAVSGLDPAVPVEVSFDDVSLKSSTPVELIPAGVLKSIIPHANDTDDDGLPDDWETQMGLNAATAANGMGQYGDPDNDGVDNLTEYQFGGNPMLFDGTPGNWTRELWRQHPSGTIHDFVRSPEFLAGPVYSDLLQAAEYQNTIEAARFGQRVRGRIVAPVTGNYRFWISGSNDFELWLSDDSTKFNKRKIASALQWGEGDNAKAVSFRDWDEYAAQASDTVHLEAGEQYFIEVLHKDTQGSGHFSVAWSHTDTATGIITPRALMSPSVLRTYPGESNDTDGDYLPDSWETTFGLNPLDNGSSDNREGEHGDYDGDLLTNHEEWLLGTDPTETDTDGDGFDDYRELHFYRSNPSVADLAPAVLAAQVNLANHTAAMGDWYSNADGSLSSTVRRGHVSYTIAVTQPGVHIIELVGRAEGSFRPVEEMPVVISIDNREVGSYNLRSINGGSGLVEAITPWLSVGTHTVKVLSDNHRAYCRLRIDSLRLMLPAGADLDNNGRPEWEDNQLANGNGVTVCPEESLVSPACVEGKARFVDQVTMVADGSNVPVVPGIDGGWFADVELAAPNASPVSVNVNFEGGALTTQRSIAWKSADVLVQPDLVVRPGDSLLLTGIPESAVNDLSNVEVTLSVNGAQVGTAFQASSPQAHTFELIGDHTVEVTCVYQGVTTTGSMEVAVRDADFGEPFPLLVHSNRTWVTPDVDPAAHVEPEAGLNFLNLAPTPGGHRQFRVSTAEGGLQHVLARTAMGGTVISTGDLIGYEAHRTDSTGDTQIIQSFPNGDRIVMMSIVMPDGIPPGGSVRLKIFVAGVTFLDGTIIKYLTAADFDANGIAYVKFNFPAGHNASICHNLVLLDAQGNEIGQQ